MAKYEKNGFMPHVESPLWSLFISSRGPIGPGTSKPTCNRGDWIYKVRDPIKWDLLPLATIKSHLLPKLICLTGNVSQTEKKKKKKREKLLHKPGLGLYKSWFWRVYLKERCSLSALFPNLCSPLSTLTPSSLPWSLKLPLSFSVNITGQFHTQLSGFLFIFKLKEKKIHIRPNSVVTATSVKVLPAFEELSWVCCRPRQAPSGSVTRMQQATPRSGSGGLSQALRDPQILFGAMDSHTSFDGFHPF